MTIFLQGPLLRRSHAPFNPSWCQSLTFLPASYPEACLRTALSDSHRPTLALRIVCYIFLILGLSHTAVRFALEILVCFVFSSSPLGPSMLVPSGTGQARMTIKNHHTCLCLAVAHGTLQSAGISLPSLLQPFFRLSSVHSGSVLIRPSKLSWVLFMSNFFVAATPPSSLIALAFHLQSVPPKLHRKATWRLEKSYICPFMVLTRSIALQHTCVPAA